MTFKEKVSLILLKWPETAFKRQDFFWKYLEEFCGVKYYITREQFDLFWREFPSAERELREQLRGRLPAEQDKNRYLKAEEMRKTYSVR